MLLILVNKLGGLFMASIFKNRNRKKTRISTTFRQKFEEFQKDKQTFQ